MKRSLLLLALLTGAGIYQLNQTDIQTVEIKEKARTDSSVSTPLQSSVTSTPVAKSSLPTAAISSITEKDLLVEEYRDAAKKLAAKVEELGLDGRDLDDLMEKHGPQDFVAKLPQELRPYYTAVAEKVNAIGLKTLKEDGMSEKFFTKYQTEMPNWMAEKRKALNKEVLPAAVAELVKKKQTETELSNNDINSILSGCGKGNAGCINKAFAVLIDANHGLSDQQLKKIQEYL